MAKKIKKIRFWAAVKVVLLSEQFKQILKSLLVKILKLQISGGIRGWLIKTFVEEFTDEIIEVVSDTVDYVDISVRVDSTVGMENRDEATDTLNDIMH